MTGTVLDSSGAVIPNARISIKNISTGEVRESTADASGFYSAPNLLPGGYEITVTAPGFSTEVRRGVTLTVGTQQVLNITMNIGQVAEKIEVTSEAPSVELASSTISGVVTDNVVVELPLNGRDWTQLATLQPGVISTQSIQAAPNTSDRAQRGYGVQMSISGSRPTQNSYRLDGINVNDYANGGPGSVEGSSLGVDAVQEFSVLRSNYSAEYGRTSGGVVNAITKSGTNQFHGDAYEFLRNSALDARNYFDPPKIPEFRRNQFGGAIGGPIQKNRTFFFVDFEGIRQTLGVSTVIDVPSADARNGIIHNADGTTTNLTVDPSVQPYLGLWGLPNGPLFSPGNTGPFTFSGANVTAENFVTTRIDHKFSDKDSIFGSFQYDKATLDLPDNIDAVLIGHTTGRRFVGIEETHIFNPQIVNSARVGFNRSTGISSALNAINPLAADSNLGIYPGLDYPQIFVPGISSTGIGFNDQGYTNFWLDSYQGYDDVFVTKGIHSLKFGVSLERVGTDENQDAVAAGRYFFPSLTGFLENQPNSIFAQLPGNVVTTKHYRQTIVGVYGQDDVRLRPTLTVNLGLRYEMTTVPSETNGQIVALHSTSDPTFTLGNPFILNPTLRNFEPRVGFAWDPLRNGKTSVRGGFGMFDVLPMPYMFSQFDPLSAPIVKLGALNGLPAGSFPKEGGTLLASLGAGFEDPYIEHNPKRNYVMQWNLSIQRELLSNLTASVAYIGSHGVHQPFRADNGNDVQPTATSAGYLWPSPVGSGAPINPTLGRMDILTWSNSSNYNGLEAQMTKKMSHGFQVQGSYTWSKSIDEGSGSAASDGFLNSIPSLFWFLPSYRRAVSDFNLSQVATINYIWTVPTPKSLHGPEAWAARGWEVGGILSLRSGQPITLEIGGDPLGLNNGTDTYGIPDRLSGPGCQSLVNPGNVSNYIKLQCFALPTSTPAIAAQCAPFSAATVSGTCSNLLGNAGRNVLNGPGLMNFDFSLFKDNKINENMNLQFRAEFFNLFNHSNFLPPIDNSTLFDQTGAPVGGAGAIDATSTTNREIQFALKLIF